MTPHLSVSFLFGHSISMEEEDIICFRVLKLFLKKNIFLIFLNYFDVLILKINLKK